MGKQKKGTESNAGRCETEIARTVALTGQEIERHAARAKAGEQKSIDLLVMHFMPMIRMSALKRSRQFGSVPIDDLVNSGVLGVLRAIRKYPGVGNFGAYANVATRTATRDCAVQHVSIVNLCRAEDLLAQHDRVQAAHYAQYGAKLSFARVAALLEWPEWKQRMFLDAERFRSMRSLDEPAGQEIGFFRDSEPLWQCVADENALSPEASYFEKRFFFDVARFAIAQNFRDRELRYLEFRLNPCTRDVSSVSDAAKAVGMDPCSVSVLGVRFRKKLARALGQYASFGQYAA